MKLPMRSAFGATRPVNRSERTGVLGGATVPIYDPSNFLP